MKLRLRVHGPSNDQRKEDEEEIEALTKQIFDKRAFLTHVPHGFGHELMRKSECAVRRDWYSWNQNLSVDCGAQREVDPLKGAIKHTTKGHFASDYRITI